MPLGHCCHFIILAFKLFYPVGVGEGEGAGVGHVVSLGIVVGGGHSMLSVGCATSATVCRAVGRQETNVRAVIRTVMMACLFIIPYITV